MWLTHVEDAPLTVTRHAAELQGVRVQRGDVVALNDVSIALPWERTTAVLGLSGSGKSTLVQLLIGLLRADRGSVHVLGVEIRDEALSSLRKRIGYAIQDIALLPHLRIRDNILLPAVLSGWEEERQAARLEELLAILHLDISLVDRYPHELSGGQQQRAGICRALMLAPELLLLDEPFSGLDTVTRRSIHAQFLEMREQIPVSTVLVTHDPEEATRLADFLCVMRGGRVQQFGTVAEVIETPATDYVRQLCTGLGVDT